MARTNTMIGTCIMRIEENNQNWDYDENECDNIVPEGEKISIKDKKLPGEDAIIDLVTQEVWLKFNPHLHVKKGNNKMEIWTDEGSAVMNIQYKPDDRSRFKTLGITTKDN